MRSVKSVVACVRVEWATMQRARCRSFMQLMNIPGCRLSLDPPVVRGFLVAVCLGILVGSGARGSAAQRVDGLMVTGSINFDIPAQSLDEALNAFSAASRVQVFYENSLTEGRRSTEVKGVFELQTALRLLLFGSGLTVRIIAANTFSIAKPQVAEAPDPAERQAKRAYVPYYGLLQAGVVKALCASVATRPGDYSVALQYSLNPSGRVERLKLIRSSGNGKRDAAIIGALQNIMLLPPGDMPQPVTIAIEPTPPEALAGCVPHDTETSRVQ
jgi:hypothetical protein